MEDAINSFYYASVVWMIVYWLLLLRRPLGASFFLISFVLFFHAFAYLYYVHVWTDELGFGLLQNFLQTNPDLVSKVTVAMASCYSCILLGCHVGDFAFPATRNGTTRVDRMTLAYLSPPVLRRLLTLVTAFELLIVFMMIVQYVFYASPTALFDYYLSDLSSADRVSIRRTGIPNFYLFAILQLTVMPMVLFVVFVEALRFDSNYLKRRAMRYGFLLVLFKLSTFSKAAPALILIQLYFCYDLYRRRRLTFNIRHVRLFLVAMLIIFAFIFMVRDELVDTGAAFHDFFYRLLMIPNEGVFEYFNAIPAYFPFGYGSGIGVITFLFGDVSGTGQHIPTYNLVASVYRGDYETVVNSFFIAEAWAQFSWAGVFVISFLAGLLVKWYDSQTAKLKHFSIKIAAIVFSVYGTYALLTAAITTALLTGGLLIIPLFARFLDRYRVSNPDFELVNE